MLTAMLPGQARTAAAKTESEALAPSNPSTLEVATGPLPAGDFISFWNAVCPENSESSVADVALGRKAFRTICSGGFCGQGRFVRRNPKKVA
jgi:hypothetical protein